MIIGLVGFAGSGKGTVGDILVEKYDYCKLSFADAVKDATSAIFGWPRNLLEGDTDASRIFREEKDVFWSARFGYDVTPRHMLQLMGTEAGRNVFHTDLWVHTVERRIAYKQEWEFETNFVIPDVRFPNEIDAIRKMGGIVIRVKRGDEPEWYHTALSDNRSECEPKVSQMSIHYPSIHYSEWAWIGQKFDGYIMNDHDIKELHESVSLLLQTCKNYDSIENL